MRNIIKGLCVCALMLSALPLQAGGDNPMYLRLDAGLSIVGNTDIKNAGSMLDEFGVDVNAKVKFDPGIKAGIAGGYMIARDWALEIESGVAWNSVEEIQVEAMGKTGSWDLDSDLFQIPIFANIVYKMPLDSRFKPYIGIGGGGVLSVITGDHADENDFTFGFQGMAGVDYEINDVTDIGIGYKFLGNIEPKFGDLKLDNVYTHSILAVFTFRF